MSKDKIPTAEEFIKERYDWSEEDLERWKEKMSKLPMADFGNVINLMDSYSKTKAEFHVEAALKAASEETYLKMDKRAILNCYPLDNIK